MNEVQYIYYTFIFIHFLIVTFFLVVLSQLVLAKTLICKLNWRYQSSYQIEKRKLKNAISLNFVIRLKTASILIHF